MKSKLYFIARLLISIGLLVGLAFYVSPANFVDTIKSMDKKWLIMAIILMPPFLICRMSKWYLLVRQVVDARFLDIIPSYLKGMAIGMFTPARSGEVIRILDSGDKTSQFYLFIVEKIIEVICLCILITLTVSKLDIHGLCIASMNAAIFIFMMIGLKIVKKAGIMILQRFSKRSLPLKTNRALQLEQVKISGCTTLSFVCFFIFMFQVYFIIRGFGFDVSLDIIFFFPFILVSNLIPVTVGGFGLREGMAVIVLSSQHVPDTVSIGSFFIVTVIDLFIPSVAGIFFFTFHKRSRVESEKKEVLP